MSGPVRAEHQRFNHPLDLLSADSSGSPVALGLLITILILLLLTVAFYIYKKKRSSFSSSVRYERTLEDSDTTGIYTD